MKKLARLGTQTGVIMLLVLLILSCQSALNIDGTTSEHLKPISIIGLCLGLYELIVRFWPTVANYSIVAFAIKVLKALSDLLNNTKKD